MVRLNPELSLAWLLEPAVPAPFPDFQGFLNLVLAHDALLVDRARTELDEDFTLELKEAWVRAGPAGDGPFLQIGRQQFEDERKWAYDEELDAVRLGYRRGAFRGEVSVSRNGLVDKKPVGPAERERIDNYIAVGTWSPGEWLAVEAYVIGRDDRTAAGDRPWFVGLRSWGEPVEDLDYWLELGHVRGRAGGRRLRGWGVDLGLTYEWPVGPRPGVTLGLAFGTGDGDGDDGRDRSFRQTGLHTNEGDFGGAAEFKYYGEILDPELSNLLILTAGVGVRPSERWSVDLVYHHYVQHRARPALRGADLEAEPSGRRRRLGGEIDLIVGVVEILDRIEVKATVGYFFPGPAFPDASAAWGVGVEAQVRF